jgi:undecaprenyl diphosphate synthase
MDRALFCLGKNMTQIKDKKFSLKQINTIQKNKVPEHIAIIMDGNRRWEKLHNLPFMSGHWYGAKVLTEIVKAASEIGVKTLTVYAFSTENWNRSTDEIDVLMHLFEVYLKEERQNMVDNGVRLDTVGDISLCPPSVIKALEATKKLTNHCDAIELVIAFNYGGRDEIKRAFVKILEDYEDRKFTKEQVTEELITKYMDTAKWKDPDLLIRTSGEKRMSNFLLWQSSYSEIFFTETLWPDFSHQLLYDMVVDFQKRKRRIGK